MLLPSSLSDSTCRKHGWWMLLVLTAVLYLPGLGTLPLMDRDEPRFAHATVEMMQRGAWVIPYFNSDPKVSDATRIEQMRAGKGAMEVGYRFDKPPLTYWWMRLHYTLFGVNEFAARLHSVIAVWLVALVTFGLASRLAGGRAGLVAGLAWLTTLQVIVHGRLCVADMPMVFFVTLACRAIVECLVLADQDSALSTKHSALPAPYWPWTLHLSLGLGFLAKGPIALLVPALALLLMRFAFWRKPLPWRRLKLWPGLLLALAIIAAWGIPALVETQGLYWKVGMQEHVVERGAKALNGRFPVPGYYLAMAFLSLFPWIALLPWVWSRVRETWDTSKAFLVSWLAAPYLIFTFYATQLPHYVMPGFPAAMVLLAICAPELGTLSKFQSRWRSVVLLILPLPLLAAATGLFILPLTRPYAPACFAFALGLGIWSQAWVRQKGFLLAALGLMLFICSLAMVSSQLRVSHPAVHLAEEAGSLPEKTELLGWQFDEPSLVYYFDRPWKFPGKIETVVDHLNRKGPRVVVLLRREWTLDRLLKDWWAGKADLTPKNDASQKVDELIATHPDYKVSASSGLDDARSSWVELRMLVRR